MRAYLKHLKSLITEEVEIWIARFLPFIFRRSLRQGLQQIWVRGDWEALPKTAFVFASNHHSWWDMYLLWTVQQYLARPMKGMMREDTLKRFQFFRRIGLISQRELRLALRSLAKGEILVIFPEGEMQFSGPVRRVQPGMAFLAQKADVPIVPLALRVVMRGALKPEAFLLLGQPINSSNSPAALTEQFCEALDKLLIEVDRMLQDLHPEALPPGFEPWLKVSKRFDERLRWLGKLWQS